MGFCVWGLECLSLSLIVSGSQPHYEVSNGVLQDVVRECIAGHVKMIANEPVQMEIYIDADERVEENRLFSKLPSFGHISYYPIARYNDLTADDIERRLISGIIIRLLFIRKAVFTTDERILVPINAASPYDLVASYKCVLEKRNGRWQERPGN